MMRGINRVSLNFTEINEGFFRILFYNEVHNLQLLFFLKTATISLNVNFIEFTLIGTMANVNFVKHLIF